MATWAKNQIAKQLAKFAKNLDPNSLSLKFLKGEGELTNLELDETVISDLLEFPPWLQLSKVTCNRISAKVPWTSLKSDSLKLLLDTVDVQIVASETLREKSSSGSQLLLNKTNAKPGKYGFAEKVIDGMFVSINTLTASFTSLGFKATVNISRIIVQSTTPEWRQTNNLRNTRIKDEERDEMIHFKEIKWGTMRVHADAAYMSEGRGMPSTPLRLITNNSIVRLIVKKRLSDCSMVASKLAVILDDILWVLTRSQILKLSSFVHYMIKLRNKHLPLSQQTVANIQTRQEAHATTTASPQNKQAGSQNQLFNAYDLKESSIHLCTQRIDLHLCDDSSYTDVNATKQNSDKKTIYDEGGAALHISLINIAVDHFPYHVAATKRITMSKSAFEEMAIQRKQWAHQLLTNFQETEGKKWLPPRNTASSLGTLRPRPTMYESYIIVSVEDYNVMQVTTPTTCDPQTFFSSVKKSLFLPKEMPAIQVDYTTYYYTGESDLPVPSTNVFVQVNPFQVIFDPLTCVWINRFTQSVGAGLDWTKEFLSREAGFAEHANIRVEALMPKILIPLTNSSEHHSEERPSAIQIFVSQAVISNCRVGAKCSQTDILNDLQSFISSRQYADMSCFPNEKSDFSPYSNSAWLNDYSINCYQLQNLTRRDKELYNRLKRDRNLPHEIWCVWCDQLWMEFIGVEKSKDRPITFVDAFPVRLWVCSDIPYYTGDTESDDGASSIRTQSSISTVSSSEMAEIARESDTSKSPVTIGTNSHGTSSHRSEDLPSRRERKHSVSLVLSDTTLLQQDERIRNPTIEGSKNQEIQPSHSDSDISKKQLSDENERDSSYAWGGPPPPYGGSPVHIQSTCLTNSMTSLPPAYDSLNKYGPGPITKPPIEEFTIIDNTATGVYQGTAKTAIIANVMKTVQVQIDHFQLISLLRFSEEVESMMKRIEFDNKESEEERKKSEIVIVKGEDSMVLNLIIPNVVLDIIMAPCVGIDPIQKLSLIERIQHEINNSKTGGKLGCPAVGDAYRLPVRSSISQSQSISNSGPNSTPTTKVRIVACDSSPNKVGHMHNSILSNPQCSIDLVSSEEVTGTSYKDVKDVQLQVGDSLMKVNLKPPVEDQLISVLRIHASGISVGIQLKGEDTIVKVASEDVSLNELGNMKYGKILDPRGSVVKEADNDKQTVNINTLTGDAKFKLRLITGPKAEQFANGDKDLGFADIRIDSLVAALLMSTVDNLGEFGEDECILPVMPFTLDISRSDISIYDDKPRRYRSAVKLPPTKVIVDELTIQRDVNGTIEVKQKQQHQIHSNQNTDPLNAVTFELETNPDANVVSSANVTSALIAESIQQQVEALIGENGRLMEDLKVVNAKVNGLRAERDSLVKVIDKLQRELINSNRENDE